jgi:hypothetical protein
MYWENVALMSIGVADYEKDGRILVDDDDGKSPRSENKSMFLQCLYEQKKMWS